MLKYENERNWAREKQLNHYAKSQQTKNDEIQRK